MATTLTLYLGVWPRAYLLQVGDSRCYLLRHGELTQITRDQTMAQELVDPGVMPAELVAGTRLAHTLSSSIGGRQTDPQVTRFDMTWGHVLLLCSDGLTRHVPDERIRDVLRSMTSAKQACEDLLQEALDDGGTDNITIVVGRALQRANRPGRGLHGSRVAAIGPGGGGRAAGRLEYVYADPPRPWRRAPGDLVRPDRHHRRPPAAAARRPPPPGLERLEILALVGAALWILGPALGHLALHLAEPGRRGMDHVPGRSTASPCRLRDLDRPLLLPPPDTARSGIRAGPLPGLHGVVARSTSAS